MQVNDFTGKRILIMGLGLHGGGVGAAKFFARAHARVTVTDLKTRRELSPSIAKLKRYRAITYHLGGHRASDFKRADYVIRNPGVPDHSPFLAIAKKSGVPILSDIEIFSRISPAQMIGITGTKGKSTTTWLLGKILMANRRWRKVWVGGNIRTSVLEFLPHVKENDLVVLELSSFQLDMLAQSRRSPNVAVITNIFPDHLNRYGSMAAYKKSKAQIFLFQNASGVLFINRRDRMLVRLARKAPGRVVRFDPTSVLLPFRSLIRNLPSYHESNIASAVAVAKYFGVKDAAIRTVLKKFRGIPGRMERIRIRRGVQFINDTTATNPGAAASAVREIKKRIGVSHRLIVIAGGFDKKLPLANFIRALAASAFRVVFLPGQASERMRRLLARSRRPEIKTAPTMPAAVRIAAHGTKPGDVVLLSPGAASFGLFQHEFDRGDRFARAVAQL